MVYEILSSNESSIQLISLKICTYHHSLYENINIQNISPMIKE